MTEFPTDIHEQILLRLGVKDLTRFKSVCTSWYSLISSHRFVKNHVNHNYEIEYIRFFIAPFMFRNVTGEWKVDYTCHIIGSSNGLVCISPFKTEIFVANPLTREVKKLQTPLVTYDMLDPYICSGFGYDSSIDDYKVLLGIEKDEDQTYFQLLSLKSNVWKSIGQVKYKFISRVGILCNGAFHWFVYDQNNKKVIMSFNLSKEEFKQIPQPDNQRYESTDHSIMGVLEDCLCIFRRNLKDIWVMKNYNVKQSWAPKTDNDNSIAHYSETQKDYISPKSSLDHIKILMSSFDDNAHIRLSTTWNIGAHVFVESLVSPHVNTSRKFIWRDPLDPEPSARV